MDELIERLDTWLAENRPDYYAALQPGLTEEELTALEDTMGVTLPEDFRTLYRWRNGQPSGHFEALAFRRKLLRGDQILSNWKLQKELQDEGFLKTEDMEDQWDVSWVPFLGTGSGDYLCVDTAGTFGGLAGQIVDFQHDDDQRATMASSLRAWLEVLVTAFETGIIASVVEVDYEPDDADDEVPTEYAVVDQEAFWALQSRLDPDRR